MIRRFQANLVSNFAAAVLAAAGMSTPAAAEPRTEFDEEKTIQVDYGTLTGPPIMAIVSIKDQRISLYDANGAAMRAPVSSGAATYETPIGIYSILQKNKEHYSNVYDDAAMPFMQRITWSGVALHEGQLPGYPASHGCVRLPNSLAEQIFPLTKIGMRVIIARDQVVPVEITHPLLLTPSPVNASPVATRTALDDPDTEDQGPRAFEPDLSNWPERKAEMQALKAVAAEKAAEVEQAKAPIADLKDVVAVKTRTHATAMKNLRAAEKSKKSADDRVTAAEQALAYAKVPARLKPWETAKAKADAAVVTATERLAKAIEDGQGAANERQGAKAERAMRSAGQAKQNAISQAARAERELFAAQLPARYKKQEEAVAKAAAAAAVAAQKYAEAAAVVQSAEADLQRATQELAAAQAALDAAVKNATLAKRKTLPVSLFVSLKTQRLYVRQGHEPVIDVPVTISEPSKPIGTHVYTAIDYAKGANSLRWTAVSLAHQPRRDVAELTGNGRRRGDTEPEQLFLTDAATAAAALDRVTLPPDILASISGSLWPGSSLIVSDEALHKETNDATDFIVLMSGELQGGIKRRPKPKPFQYYNDDWYASQGYGVGFDRYGRRVRIIQKKSFFNWW